MSTIRARLNTAFNFGRSVMANRKTRQQYQRDTRLYGLLAFLMLTLAFASHLQAQSSAGDPRDLTQLPIGDYKLSDKPEVGYVYRCGNGTNTGIGGAQVDGP